MVVTPKQAREMKDAIRQLEDTENQQAQAQNQALIGQALSWFNTQGINIPAATTRTKALDIFQQIQALLQTETDKNRLRILREKINEANDKYKEVKRANPHS